MAQIGLYARWRKADLAQSLHSSRRLSDTAGTVDPPGSQRRYSARNASDGEIKLARTAGTMDASSADDPSARMAANGHRRIVGIHPVELSSQQSPGGKRQRQPYRESQRESARMRL